MNTILCYKSKLGKPGDGGDWDADSAVGHAVNEGTGRTLCGVKIGIDIRHGGRWEDCRYRYGVTCQRCLKRLASK